jgi:benzene/toluene dioxygenase ferredoxin reductase subunit
MLTSVGIVGTGLAGVTVAQALRLDGFKGRILLFGDEDHHAYDRPSLSKSALTERLEAPVRFAPMDWHLEHNLELYGGTSVTSIDVRGIITTGKGDAVEVDRIVLATGAHARRLSIPGAELPGVLVLRTWRDMEALRERLRPGTNVAILGGGLIGCEVATSAVKLGAAVTVFEAGPELLERVLGSEIGSICRTDLEALGVRVVCNARIAGLGGATQVETVVADNGETTPVDLVLTCIGGEPADELAAAAGIACDRGIIVDAAGQSSAERVFAVGDVAKWPLISGPCRSLETYLNTEAQARCVARVLLGFEDSAPQLPLGWTEIAGKKIQVIGDIEGPGSFVRRSGPNPSSLLKFRIDNDSVMQAALAIDAPGDFAAAKRIVESGCPLDVEYLANTDITMRDIAKKYR